MRLTRFTAALASFLALAGSLPAQQIIAQTSGLVNPHHVQTFGSNLFPNFTPVTTQFPGVVLFHSRYFTTGTYLNLVGGFITNDPFVGGPNTLRIVFANAIHDVSFVYQQIGTSQASVFRAMLAGSTVDQFSYLGNQTTPNNYYGFTNLVFDEVQIDFDGDFNVDTVAYNDVVYASCTMRNGSNVNPAEYGCLTSPIIGTTWMGTVVLHPNTVATWLALAPGGPHPGFPSPFGEVLVQLTPMPVLISGSGSFSVAIPNVGSLIGIQAATQAARVDAVGPSQSIVLLNAVDLVVGI